VCFGVVDVVASLLAASQQGPYPNRGSCVFAQTSVMRSGSSRDKRQQSRLLRGNSGGFEICTVNHLAGGTVRLDATIEYRDDSHEVCVAAPFVKRPSLLSAVVVADCAQ